MGMKFSLIGVSAASIILTGLLAITDWNPLIAAMAAAIGVAVPVWMQIQRMKAENALLRTQQDLQRREQEIQGKELKEVKALSNGLTKELMHVTEKGALAKGAADEKIREAAIQAMVAKAVAEERLRAETEAKKLLQEKVLTDATVKPNIIVGDSGHVVVDDPAQTPIDRSFVKER